MPLVESMFFDIPIVAKNTTAIPYTLGGSGFLLEDENPVIAAALMNRILTDEDLKNKIIVGQRERLQDFAHEKIERQLLSLIEEFIK